MHVLQGVNNKTVHNPNQMHYTILSPQPVRMHQETNKK